MNGEKRNTWKGNFNGRLKFKTDYNLTHKRKYRLRKEIIMASIISVQISYTFRAKRRRCSKLRAKFERKKVCS